MKLIHPALKINHQKAHSLLDQRYAERVPIRCHLSYHGEDGARIVTREGTLKNLSKAGCKIFGAPMHALGSSLTIFFDFEDGQPPLCLIGNTVSWVSGDSFAVRFPKLSPEERKRLQEVIWKSGSVSSLDDRRAAFRIL